MNKIKKQPMVSVCMVTYNHEKYISQALDSILMQKVNFEYEIVVGEDCSTDNTRKILLDYYEKYPDLIKLVLQKSNTGIGQNVFDTLNACSGKYTAVLDGDDYWIDVNKLQNQVNILERNPEFGMIHSRANIVNENNKLLFISENNQPSGDVFDYLIFKNSFILTCTICFRKQLIDSLMEKIKRNNINYLIDYYIWLYVAMNSKIQFIDDITSVQRSHAGGVTKKGNELHKKTMPYILTDIISKRFLISPNKKINFNKRIKYGLIYSRALLSKGMKMKDRFKRFSFYIKQFYLIPLIPLSLLIKLFSFTKKSSQFKAVV